MFVFAAAAGCSDDDSTPGDAGKDAGPSSGGGNAGQDGAGTGGGGSGGSSPTGQSGTSGAGTGGRGGSGSGGSGGSGVVDGGTDGGERCGDVTCDAIATCDESGDEPTCECPFGYDDVSGFGTKCEEHDPPLCMDDGDCDTDHCVDGVCCEKACDDPPTCHTDDGATCEDGEHCEYPDADDGDSCDDDDICTDDDECNDGECEGTEDDCDDGKFCTDDSCDSDATDEDSRCINDGTDNAGVECADDTMCATGYKCAGNVRGDCNPTTETDCSGEDDQCNLGTCQESDGSCLAVPYPDGIACDDEDACNDGETCQTGNCEGGSARVCNDGNVCTNDTCNSVSGCLYTNNTVVCTDSDPCTVNEHCAGGSCNDVDPKDCSAQNDQCNDGACNAANGNCIKQPKAGSAIACNDSLNCTNNETCSAGSCVDANPDSACGAGSLSCPTDNPRVCTCDTANGYAFDMTSRTCKADVCDPTPCSANASCDSDLGGNPFCTCNTGYVDTNVSTNPVAGVTCTDINACTGNPCGANGDVCTDQAAPALGYTCTCDAGFTPVDATDDGTSNPTCVCDIGGTYAIRIRTDLAWTNLDNISDGTETTYSWAIRQHTYSSSGQLQVVTTSCGGTTPELCGDGASAGLGGPPAQAYSQYVTNGVWQTPDVPVENVTFSVPNPQTGGTFSSAQRAVLLGIQLTNPMGTWPVSHCAVSGTLATECPSNTVTPVNGAAWTNPDADAVLGVTTNAVPPGGINIDGTPPDPPCADIAGTSTSCPNYELTGGADAAYGSVSAVCPRGGGTALPYANFPGLEGFTIRKDGTGIKRFSVASRVISGLEGTFASCDRITGDVTGPDTDGADADTNGEMRTDARVFDCVRGCTGTTGGCSGGEVSCSEGLAEFFDNTTHACTTAGNCDAGYRCNNGRCEAQRLTDASFIIKRVPAGLIPNPTCAEIRAMDFN